MKTQTVHNASAVRYPRAYEIGGRRTITGIALCFTSFGVFAPFLRILLHSGEPVEVQGNLISAFAFVGFAAWMAWWANHRVILDEDAIELRTWFSSRKLAFVDIAGYYIRHPQSKRATYRYIIQPRDPRERAMKLPPYVRYDKAFYA